MNWLPPIDDDGRAGLAGLSNLQGADLRGSYLSVLDHAWQEPELRKIGRQFSRALSARPDAAARYFEGFAIVRLLIFAPHTMKHLVDALVATGLRDGIAIEATVVEHADPAQWLHTSGKGRAFDNVLFCANLADARLQDDFTTAASGRPAVWELVAQRQQHADLAMNQCGARAVFELTPGNHLLPMAHLDQSQAQAARRLLTEYNNALADMAAQHGHLLLDLPQLVERAGAEHWWSFRYWHVGKFPFSDPQIPLYLTALCRVLGAAHGRARRVLVTDLDNTLWGGVIGDDGIEGINIGQGNALGEAFAAIQLFLLKLKQRGIVLCIASKNNIEIALEPLNKHPDMLLRERDFTLIKANWQDKAGNIRAMAETLNLGLDSFVFLDDNPVERKQVRENLPMVAVPELPEDRSHWPMILASAGYFEYSSMTREDLERSRYYAEDAKREQVKQTAQDHESFLKSLQMRLNVKRFDGLGRKRIVQLIGKSNQFNLTTLRYSDAEVASLEADENAIPLQARLEDMYGDNGIISCVVAVARGNCLEIDLWVMSCRVIGRMVEQAILTLLIEQAVARGLTSIKGVYIESPRNSLVRDHYAKLGFVLHKQEQGRSEWLLDPAQAELPRLPFDTISGE